MKTKSKISIKNKKALFKYEVIESYIAGICLIGTEVKSIREGKISFSDSYCFFDGKELILKNFHISEYENGTFDKHEPLRDRKLLLTKKELRKLKEKVKDVGLTIVPIKIFINEKNIVKFDIALVKGKKQFDHRESIKNKDLKREENRRLKI
ncbi:SsrA-binding protein SmpB [Candidatus Dojkabacteria bacterium]|jgi:SsrA-binding protein|nr:SsrA-binding protein SmpB [Candidatus Dojkabacteria bacterium]